MSKSKAPVFVLGCPRSGTTLLYHMLLSSGDFAVYRAETHIFNLVAPHFGNLANLSVRTRMIDAWVKTDYFARTGLAPEPLRNRVLDECRSPGDFLRIVMESIAAAQGVSRWSECTPEHLLYIRKIKRSIPEAKIIHIIRDGRDVAASLDKQGWIRPLPSDENKSLLVAGLYWEWIVKRGRRLGAAVAPDYIEVRFEDLISRSHDTLAKLSRFIDHQLDFDEIKARGIGSVREPNTSFPGSSESAFNPVERWRERSQSEIRALESLIGRSLRELGYSLADGDIPPRTFESEWMRLSYEGLFSAKHWLKSNTPLGRRADASLLYAPIGGEPGGQAQTKQAANGTGR
jgi:hypothetical protein